MSCVVHLFVFLLCLSNDISYFGVVVASFIAQAIKEFSIHALYISSVNLKSWTCGKVKQLYKVQ